MSKSSNLHRRGATYYARIHVPTDLIGRLGKKDIWRSLNTKEYGEANSKVREVVAAWHATFEGMREQRELNEDDISIAVWRHYQNGVDVGDDERLARPAPDDVRKAGEAALDSALANGASDQGPAAVINSMTDYEVYANKAEWQSKLREKRLARFRRDLASGDTALVEGEADAYLVRNSFNVDRRGPLYRKLCFHLMRAEMEMLETYAAQDKGNFTRTPEDPIVKKPEHLKIERVIAGESTLELFAKYEAANPGDTQHNNLVQTRLAIENFVEFVGDDLPASKIARRHVRDWKQLLAGFPVRAKATKVFEGLTLKQIVEANKALNAPKRPLSRQSVRRYMSGLGGFCRWLVQNDYLETNPVADMLPKKAPPTHSRKTFTDVALFTLFNAPLFKGASGPSWRQVDHAGEVKIRDHRYWIPLVMLYSGARPSEIAQLDVGDVREQHGIWTMHITTEGDGDKRTKTKGSMRVVPLHSELVRLGFVKHCKAMKTKDEKKVFPEVETSKSGQIAAVFSREFNRYLSRLGIKTGPDIVVYSLRHTFVDRLRLAGISDLEIGMLIGHGKPTMTGQYGVEQQGTLERRSEIIECISFRGS